MYVCVHDVYNTCVLSCNEWHTCFHEHGSLFVVGIECSGKHV